MKEQTIELRDILALLGRNFWLIVLSIAVATAGAGTLAYYLPKRFKSQAVLAIQASYFQNPLVKDLISDVYDPSELNAQRAALLRFALDNSFLDKLGDEYGVYKYPANDPMRNFEREELLKSIEFFSVTPGTFQISVNARKQLSSQKMTKEVLDQVVNTLIAQRSRLLIKTRNAIEQHLKALTTIINTAGTNGGAGSAEVVKAKLDKIETDMRMLQQHFTDQHPEVVRLREKAGALRSQLESLPPPSAQPDDETSHSAYLLSTAAEKPLREVYDDLLKKLSNLDIVLNIERDKQNLAYLAIIEQPSLPTSAVFPRMSIFLACGFILGIVGAAILVVYVEVVRGTFMSPDYLAEQLEIPLLGELPAMTEGKKVLALDYHNSAAGRKRLPLLDKEGVNRR